MLLSPSLSPSHYSLSNWLGSWVPPLIILSPPLSLTHTLTHVLSLFYSFTDSHTLTDQSTISPVIPVQVTTSNSSKAACSWPSPGSRTLWSSVFVCPCVKVCFVFILNNALIFRWALKKRTLFTLKRQNATFPKTAVEILYINYINYIL